MANITSTLLTAEEWQSLYEPPKLSDSERIEYIFLFQKINLKHCIASSLLIMPSIMQHYYPRQRQLCKALLQLMVKEHIAIPGITTIQDCVTLIWNREQSRVVRFYYGTRLKQLNPDVVQLYFLYYSYSRFQLVNDNLLEAFKKHTSNYTDEFANKAEIDAAKYVDKLQAVRYKIHELIVTIKNDTHKTHIQKSKLFRCMPEPEMDHIAKILTSEKLDPRFLFWKHIDSNERSISLNLRPLFMNLDISIINDDLLRDVVNFMRDNIENTEPAVPEYIMSWIPKSDLCYLMSNKKIIKNRFEFFLYQ